MDRDPYSPPTARVADPAAQSRTNIRARVHIGLGSLILLLYAAYLVKASVLPRDWLAMLSAILPAAAGGLLLLRKPFSRFFVPALAVIAISAWLFYSILVFLGTDWRNERWLVNLLMWVPGIALVVLPMIYCAYVARTYVHQSTHTGYAGP